MDGISGISSNISTPQINTSPVVGTSEVQDQESIFAKKGGGGGVDIQTSIFSQCSAGDITSSVPTDNSATAL